MNSVFKIPLKIIQNALEDSFFHIYRNLPRNTDKLPNTEYRFEVNLNRFDEISYQSTLLIFASLGMFWPKLQDLHHQFQASNYKGKSVQSTTI